MFYSAQKTKEGRILPLPGVTILTFPDGSQCVVTGLNEIFSDMYDRGTPVSLPTARKISKKAPVTRYIDESFRQQYHHLLLEEYRKYCDAHVCGERLDGIAKYVYDEQLGLAGVVWNIFCRLFPSSHPWPLSVGQKHR